MNQLSDQERQKLRLARFANDNTEVDKIALRK